MAWSVRWSVGSVGAVCLGYGLFACFSNDLPAIDTSGRTPSYALNSGGSSSEDSGIAASCTGQGGDGGCSDLVPCGGQNYAQQVAQAIPTQTGGEITPGIYFMSNYTLYTGAGGGTAKEDSWQMETFTVGAAATDGGTGTGDAGPQESFVWNDAVESNSAGAESRSGYVLTQGNSLTFQGACPTSFTASGLYTATTTQIVIDLGPSAPLGESVVTFTLQ